jgi:2,5-diamino-6-(ribosylamino)-4(3H)-pyrimidinone 5'-phosphate reductase
MKSSKQSRPHIICHMVSSVDGRIQPHRWPMGSVQAQYEKCHKALNPDAWIVGRTTMESFSSSKFKRLPKTDLSIKMRDCLAAHSAKSYAIVIDPSGKCRWESNDIGGDHVIEVLTEQVSLDYLAHLQHKKVSYVFAGRTSIDLHRAARKLRALFGIRRLLLEGGGLVNGSFLKAGLIDELSLLIIPIADGSIGTPTVFDVERGHTRRNPGLLRLKRVKRLASNVVWLRYAVRA